MPLDTESWGPDSCAGVKPTPLPLQTVLQHYIHYRSHTVTWYVFFLYYSGSCTWHLHSFALCTVGCTLGKQNKFTLKIGLDWRIQNWGACSRSQAMTLQTPLPSRMYRRNLLKWPDILFQQYLHVSEFCKLRTSNASEVNKSLSYSYTILQ